MSAAGARGTQRPNSTGQSSTATASSARKAGANMSAALAKLEKQLAGLGGTGGAMGASSAVPSTSTRGTVSAGGPKKVVGFTDTTQRTQPKTQGVPSAGGRGGGETSSEGCPTKVSRETESILNSIDSFDLFQKGGSGSSSRPHPVANSATTARPRPPNSQPAGQSPASKRLREDVPTRSSPMAMASSGVGGDEELPAGALWGAPPQDNLDVWGNPLNGLRRGRLGDGATGTTTQSTADGDDDENPLPNGTVFRQLTAEEMAQRSAQEQQNSCSRAKAAESTTTITAGGSEGARQRGAGPKTSAGGEIKVVRAGTAGTTRIGPELIRAVQKAASVSKQQHSPLYFLHLNEEIERQVVSEQQ